MNDITFSPAGWEDYLYWQQHDKKTLRKINDLLDSIRREGLLKGIGKPEALRYTRGYSRRIDDANRLVYDVDDLQNIRVLSCCGHYEQ